jgi:hypothetical protein
MTALPEGWHAPTTEKPWDGLTKQLQKEVGEGHVLKGLKLTLIARRLDCDDALFALDDGQIAEVHLTWRNGPEIDPRFPATAIFRNMAEWTSRATDYAR